MGGKSRYAIDIAVSTRFVPEQSDPGDGRFVFAYTIHLRNDGEVAARLLNRHWVITDGNGKVTEVRGEGVVGEQPLLAPGESFQYTSGAVLETTVGTMHGEYEWLAEDGEQFLAPVPRFALAIPRTLH
ncbi:MAG TPA: Co2+/Mg2+ efflux protein ApaG [Xanthomonadaceae bacterium]|nr:Co2+/Mg2+ efflux protein ApaG [Xanthomonadaceae bacterium]